MASWRMARACSVGAWLISSIAIAPMFGFGPCPYTELQVLRQPCVISRNHDTSYGVCIATLDSVCMLQTAMLTSLILPRASFARRTG